MKCKNCGKPITQYGPETYHTGSTMIRCDMLQRPEDTTPPKATPEDL